MLMFDAVGRGPIILKIHTLYLFMRLVYPKNIVFN